jgi:hypothetical protein
MATGPPSILRRSPTDIKLAIGRPSPRIPQFNLPYLCYLTYLIYCRDVTVDIVNLDDVFHPAAAPTEELWTSRSTPALWVRCVASESQPTNVTGVITPAEK